MLCSRDLPNPGIEPTSPALQADSLPLSRHSGSDGKASAYNVGDLVRSLGWEDPLEKEMATYSSIFAWKSPWMEEPGRLYSTGLQRVGHD